MPGKKRSQRASQPAADTTADFFNNWRHWLLGALVGSALAWLAYIVVPPPFRVSATVVVDHNLEEAWVYFPDRQLFQFLQRETERLEELAWSDAVMEDMAQSSGLGISGLRNGILELSHPSDGGWHFYATHADPAVAENLARTWAGAFVVTARAAVSASPELEQARVELQNELDEQDVDEERIKEILEEISLLAEHTRGISPYVELAVSQSNNPSLERRVSLGAYLLAGSLIGAIALPAYPLFRKDS